MLSALKKVACVASPISPPFSYRLLEKITPFSQLVGVEKNKLERILFFQVFSSKAGYSNNYNLVYRQTDGQAN